MPVARITLARSVVRTPLDNLIVEVVSATPRATLVHVALTDAHGRATIELSEPYLNALFGANRPQLHFRVWHKDRLLADTARDLLWYSSDEESDLRIDLRAPSGALTSEPLPHRIFGRVAASAIESGWRIEAWDQPVRGAPKELDRAELDAGGSYELSYARSELRPSGKVLADLVLVVRDAQKKERYRSQVLRRAAPALHLDVVVDAGAAKAPSTFARLELGLKALLDGAGPEELGEEELAELAASAGLEEHAVRAYAAAFRFSSELAARRSPVHLSPQIIFGLSGGTAAESADIFLTLRAIDLRAQLARANQAQQIDISDAERADAEKELHRAAGALEFPKTAPKRSILSRLSSIVDQREAPTEPNKPAAEPTFGAGALLASVLESPEHASTLMRAWFAHEGDAPSFWKKLEGGFADPDLVERARSALQLDAFTLGDHTLTKALLAEGIKTPAELVRYDRDRWEQALKDAPLPEGAGSISEYAAALSAAVELSFPHAYLTARLTDAPREDEAPLASFLRANDDFDFTSTRMQPWLARTRAADPRRVPAPETLELVSKYARTFRLVQGRERLDRMRTLIDRGLDSAPKIARLGKDAFMATHAKALGGEAQALPIFRRAMSATLVAHTLMFRYRRDLNGRAPWAAGKGGAGATEKFSNAEALIQGPNWTELFGSADSCACPHCQSVLSPAAYLTDLLHFIVDPPTGGTHPGWYDKLKSVRPDIPNILLDCNNSNTVLPYIDLVNEVLEHAVALRVLAAPLEPNRQTTGRTPELLLHPEHLSSEVYETLAGSGLRFPWKLPFDLHDEEARAYVELAATKRHTLMGVFAVEHLDGEATRLERQDQIRERLALPPAALAIIISPAADGGAADWGLTAADAEWTHPATANVADPSLEGSALGVPVRRWMRRGQLTYEELDAILRCRSLNPAENGFRVRVLFEEGTCDLHRARLAVSDGASSASAAISDPWVRRTLGRIPRFVRMWRALGWSIFELDKALLALGGSLDANGFGVSAAFIGLGEIDQLRRDLKAPIEEIVTWFASAPMPTDAAEPGALSLYDRSFQDPGRGPLDSGPLLTFLLNTERTELAVASPITAATPMISTLRPSTGGANVAMALGGLRLKADALEALLDLLYPNGADSAAPLTLARLSRLYGAASFARALKWTHADFIRLAQLSGQYPFAGPVEVRAFVDEARRAQGGDRSLARIELLLRRHLPAVEHAELGRVLRTIRARIAETRAELAPVADASGARLSEILATLLPETLENPANPGEVWPREALVEVLTMFAGGTGVDDLAAWQTAFDETWPLLETVEGLAPILARIAPDAAGGAGELLRDPTWSPDQIDLLRAEHPLGSSRYDFLQGALLQLRRETIVPARVVEVLALALKLDGDVLTELLHAWVQAAVEAGDLLDPPIDPSEPAMALFLHPTFAGAVDPEWPEGAPDPLVSEYPAQSRTVSRLFAVAQLLVHLEVTREELPLLFGALRDPAWLDPSALPIEEDTDPADVQARYAAWRRLRDAWRVRASMGGATGPFAQLLRMVREARSSTAAEFAATTAPAIRAVLADRLGWPDADLAWLLGAQAFDATEPALWTHERWWQRLSDAVQLLHRTGLGARLLWSLSRRPTTAALRREQSELLKQAVRARYDDASWPIAARPVRDALRERQRDALVTWLLAHALTELDSADDLYRHFLIDVQMGACGETSRIREALSAVQLFVQQGMLGVIEDVVPSFADRDAWEWMSRYRVWEANRKVFLWPEHWMEPELRHDKSPFYEELEKAVLKDDITEENVARAYQEYLTKLDEVSRLEVRASLREIEPAGETNPDKMTVDRLHVVARTRAVPHRYFHRVREPGHALGVWGPWRPVGADIDGDHLLPAIANRRLYLFWPQFQAKESAPETMKVPPATSEGTTAAPSESHKWLEVQLAWTRLHEGQWTPRQVSRQHASLDHWTDDSRDKLILMSWSAGQENYVLLCAYGFVHAAFRVIPEAGIFDLIDLQPVVEDQEIDDEFYFNYTVPPPLKIGRHSRAGRTPRSLAMSYLAERDTSLQLADTSAPWLSSSPVLEGIPSGFDLLPLYTVRARPPFPSLFFHDAARAFVIDPIEDWVHYGRSPLPQKFKMLRAEHERPAADARAPWEKTIDESGLILGGLEASPTTSDPSKKKKEKKTNTPELAVEARDVPVHLDFDGDRRVLISPELSDTPFLADLLARQTTFRRRWLFRGNYHPYLRLFIKHLNAYGLKGLLDPRLDEDALDNDERKFLRRQGLHTGDQLPANTWRFDSSQEAGGYEPTDRVVAGAPSDSEYWDLGRNTAYPNESIDFSEHGTYSLYNWELFFHAPLMIAVHLSRSQRFEEARRWFHYIFDPTDAKDADEETPQHFWKLKPLYQTFWAEDPSAQSIDVLLRLFAEDTASGARSAIYADVQGQIQRWLDNPFNPWAIAQLRFSSYQRTVVLKYIDNLMAWADSLFRQYTIEAIGEARLMYVLVSDLLGPRPEVVETRDPAARSFQQLYDSGDLDAFSNALVNITAELDPTPDTAWDDLPPVLSPSLYFCVPRDEKLVGYWDRVEDRLYKIRHCLDIDGVARPLALFDPPIDPGALVRAVAGGAGIAGALASLNAPIPAFRYEVMVRRAKELCSDLRSFGSALLVALEKRDGEALAQLRGAQELAVLDAITELRRLQITEARNAKEALEKSKAVTDVRRAYYQRLIEGGWSPLEITQMSAMVAAGGLRLTAGVLEAVAAALVLVPQIDFGASGFGGSPKVTAAYGGQQISGAVKFACDVMNLAASTADSVAGTTGLAAAHLRRAEEWQYQRALAEAELEQMRVSVDGAQLRIEIAERELDSHLLQRKNAEEATALVIEKFTNVDLYDWMVGQLAAVYVQAYQLALDVARRAERAWQFEVAASEPPQFIQASHWDTLRKGLLAGERLAMDLHRMEVAYVEHATREYELTRHVSLALLDPAALLALKATGRCEIFLPEMFFDVDRPGLYHRRVKAVSLSLPCVAGPYAPVHVTLRLLESYVRTTPQLAGTTADDYGTPTPDDPRFTLLPGPAQGVITSRAVEDAGLFGVSLEDQRYLPFEGHGVAHSRWRIELPDELRAFDYTTISDAILHLRYTAREGGERLQDAANAAISAWIATEVEAAQDREQQRVFALRTENIAEWNALFQSTAAMELNLRAERFPFMFRRASAITPVGGQLWVFGSAEVSGEASAPSFTLAMTAREDGDPNLPDAIELDLPARADAPGIFSADFELEDAQTGAWRLSLTDDPQGAWASGDPARLSSSSVREIYLIVRYRVG